MRLRVEQGLTNAAEQRTSRTFTEIVRANIFTRFNAILGTMFVLILIVGPFQDALFGVVLVANALIGIVQECAGQADARPPRGAQRAAWRVSCATARAARSRSTTSCSTT